MPGLHNMTMSMRKGPCIGLYTLYTADWTIPGGISYESRIDIFSGDEYSQDSMVDDFNSGTDLPGNCAMFHGPAECEAIAVTAPAFSTRPTATAASTIHTTLSSVVGAPTSSATETPSIPDVATNTTATHNHSHDFHPGRTFTGFFQYFTNYFVNFFFKYVWLPWFPLAHSKLTPSDLATIDGNLLIISSAE